MGDVVRIYGGPVDPLERGPPRRVGHMVDNIGEHIASSKKRASWKFTLGESDKVHEIVLLHSIMSTKKVVEYDGREQYHNSTITPGDWTLILMLEGLNIAMEVRINEYETPETPKYDLLIDRVPFRKMDIYRRNVKRTNAPQLSQGHIQQGFHQSHWGPGGAVPESSAPVAPASSNIVRESSKRNSGKSQPEINLIDASAPELTVPVQALVFDPLVTGAPLPSGQQQATSPVNLNAFFTNGQPQAGGNARPPTSQNYDPFANLQPNPKAQAPGYYGGNPQYAQGYGFVQPPPAPQQGYRPMVMPGQYTTPPTPNPVYPPYNPQANLNISNMMNPMQVQHGIQPKKTTGHDIDINPFAGMR